MTLKADAVEHVEFVAESFGDFSELDVRLLNGIGHFMLKLTTNTEASQTRELLRRKGRDALRGSPRFLAVQRTLARNDNSIY